MPSLVANLSLDAPTPARRRPVSRLLLIGDVATARAGVPELLIQMARSEDREGPPPHT